MLYYENYNYTKLFIIDSVIYDPNIYYFAISLQIPIEKRKKKRKY